MNEESQPPVLKMTSMFLPPQQHVADMLFAGRVVINGSEPFRKSTWQNRCLIASAQGPLLLSVPVAGGRGVRLPVRDVRICNDQPWQRIHWNSLKSAYGKSSYFQYYESYFSFCYTRHFDFLIDLNIHLLKACFAALQWEKDISIGERSHIRFSKGTSQALPDPFPAYHQVFEASLGFIPGLSIVDLIFNTGPDASLYLTTLRERLAQAAG